MPCCATFSAISVHSGKNKFSVTGLPSLFSGDRVTISKIGCLEPIIVLSFADIFEPDSWDRRVKKSEKPFHVFRCNFRQICGTGKFSSNLPGCF